MSNMADVKAPGGHQLYHLSGCPFCIKVRVMMWWLGVKIPLRNIAANPEYRHELIAGGGKEQVPCLRIEHGDGQFRWLYESSDIIRYLKSGLAA